MTPKVISRRARRHAEAARHHRAAEDYAAARTELERALAIVDRGPPPWSSPLTRLRWARAGADLRAGLGEIGLEQGRPDLARKDLEAALHRYEELSHAESADISTLLNNLGVVYERLGLATESVDCLTRAVDIDRRTGRPAAAIVTALSNIALSYESAGYREHASQALAEAARLADLAPEWRDRLAQEQAFHRVAGGDYADGLVALTGQLDALADQESITAASLLGNLAQAYAELQRWEEAESRHRRSVEIRRRRQPDSLPLALALANLASTVGVRDAAEARDLLDEAVRLGERIAPQSPELAVMRGQLAGMLLDGDDPAGAATLARRAISAAPGANRYLVGAYLVTALADAHRDDTGSAERMLAEAERICHAISPLLPELRIVLSAKGWLARQCGRRDEAVRCFDRAIEVAESRRAGSAAEPGLELLFGTARTAYHGRIVVAHERGAPGDPEAAFRAAEAVRARTLTELLARVDAPGAQDPAAADLTARLAAVRDELRQVYSQLGFHPDAPLTHRRAELEQLQESLRIQLRAAAPDGPYREHEPPCTVAQIQACLDPTTVLAMYEVTEDGVFAWVVRTTGLVFTRLAPEPAELIAAVDEVLTACRDEESEPPADALRRLGEWLLEPLTGTFDHLVVCAGDILAHLPFEALERNNEVLADRCVFWSVPSATTVVRFGSRPPARQPALDFAGFAVSRTDGMRPLPSATREVRDIAALFPGRSAKLVDDRATLAAVRADAPASRYVHFAAHGVIDDAQPFFSGLPLTPADGDDGFLSAYRISGLSLRAELVSCSACETAVGQSRPGEGIVGLSYALFGAGARALLLSRWPVRDPVARRLMVNVYRELAAGSPVSTALHRAARRIRRDHPHPREWAGFLLLDTATRRNAPC